jgi:hypothetical protein
VAPLLACRTRRDVFVLGYRKVDEFEDYVQHKVREYSSQSRAK